MLFLHLFSLYSFVSRASLAVGFLVSIDNYMNVQLGGVEEWIDGALAGKLGEEVVIRCNNVLHIRGAALSEEAANGAGHEKRKSGAAAS